MNNFCPAPWMSLFYQIDQASVCCASNDKLKMSPEEFRNSDYLRELKKQFLAKEKPAGCNGCWQREDQKLISIRNHYLDRFPKYNYNFFDSNTQLPVEHMELRASNLCNFQCRMCYPENSVEIAREVEKTPSLQKHFKSYPSSVMEIDDANWRQIFDISLDTSNLFLTGGEPLLIKHYYDLLDHLIANDRCEHTALNIYTNCSVFNPKFVDRIIKFKNVRLSLSIDAVGKVAEYQRYGTIWNTVKNNAIKFSQLSNIKPIIHTTITAYNILDLAALADFYLQMLEENNNTQFMVHVAYIPKGINYMNLPKPLKTIAIEQIDMALLKLKLNTFNNVCEEFKSIKQQLLKDSSGHIDFIRHTMMYDKSRNQKFEDVFNFKLY